MDTTGDYAAGNLFDNPETNDTGFEVTDIPTDIGDIPEAPEIEDASADTSINDSQEMISDNYLNQPIVLPNDLPDTISTDDSNPDTLPPLPDGDAPANSPSTPPDDPIYYGRPGGPEALPNIETEPRPEPHFPEAPIYGGGPERGY